MANYNGLTRNQWPGTWSPNANHPIVLDTEIRGGLRLVSGDSGDKVSDITGQRLQDGMLIYVKTAHDGYEADKYYRYQVLPGESRDSNTGELPNASGNWEIMRFPIDSATATALIDSAYIKGIADSDYIKTVTGIDADTLDGQEGSFYRDYNNLTNKPLILDNVDVSNIIVNDVDKAFVDALNVDADTLDNLNSTQFLRSDQSDSMVGSLTIDSNLTVGGYIAGPTNMIIDPARVGTDSGTVQILGNLQVEGTTTTINSTTVSINDKNIILADSAANAAAADGAGITIAGANATLQYSASGDKFVFNKSFEGDWLGFDADFALKSTSDLSEGTNLYYTTARADSDFDVRLATKTTTDVAEGTNLYYTKARVDSDISSAFDDSSNTVNVTINNFIEDKVDSAYVLARVNEAPFLDSASALALIDSAYISTVYDQSLNTTDDVIFNTVQAPVTFRAKNDAGSTLNVGEVVYIKGVDGNTPTVDRADADDANKMPAFGIVAIAANNQANVEIVTFGALQNVNTTGFNLRDTLYVSTTPGQLTNVKPSGTTSLIQNIAKVVRVASNGIIRVGGAGRTNATPNLDAGQIFYGNDSNYSVATDLTSVVDSAYVQARTPQIDLSAVDQHIIPAVDSTYDLGSPTLKWRDLYLSGNSLYLGGAQIHRDGEDFRVVDSQGNLVRVLASNIHSALVDSAFISNFIDSSYINARVEAGTDSATVIALIDSAYVQARQVDLQRDSGFVTNIVDSAYVTARAGVGTDSSTVVSIIDSHVDATFINNLVIDADTLGGNDSTYYLDYNNFTNTPTIPTVDKVTIDALNIDADTLDGQQGTYYLNYQNFTNTPNVLDSSEVTNIFADNLTTEGLRGVESIEFVHDSDYTTFTVAVDTKTTAHRYHGTGSTNGYVIRGVESPFFQLVPGNIYRFDMSNGTNAGHPLAFYYDAAKTTQYTSGVTTSGIAGQANAYVEIMIDDNTPSVLHYQCTNHGYMGNAIFVQTRNLTGFDTDDLSEGSSNLYYTDARVTSHVDSAYVALRQNYAWSSLTGVPKLIDSALVTQLIDSAYIAARESGTGTGAGGLDSDAIFAIIDSAYIQAREAVSAGGANVAFKTITVSGQNDIVAATATDTLTFEAGTNITLATDAATKTVTINSSGGGGGGGVADGLTLDKFTFTATAGQLVFADSDDNGTPLAYNSAGVDINVYLNGILLVDSADFTKTDSSTITLIDSAEAGDNITIVKFTPPQASAEGVDSAATITLIQQEVDSNYVQARQSVSVRGTLEVNKYFFEADQGDTVFSGADKFGNTFLVDPDNTEVYINGILQELTTDYTIVDSNVTFTEALDSGYSVSVIETVGRVVKKNTLAQTTYQFTADSGQTVFSGTDNESLIMDLSSGVVEVYLNGILLSPLNDFTREGNAITLTSAADSADFLSVVNTKGALISGLNIGVTKITDTTGTTLNKAGFSYTAGSIQVFKNGDLLAETTDYTATDGTNINLTSAAIITDVFLIQQFSGAKDLKTVQYQFLADSGQTTFSGEDRRGDTLTYAANAVTVVYVNGIALQDSDDYTATNGYEVTLTTAAAANDDIKILSYVPADLSKVATPLRVQSFEFTADSGQTTFTGADDNAQTLDYSANRVNVYLNGILMQQSDFAATNGTSVVLTEAADSGDVLTVLKYTGNNIGVDSSTIFALIDEDYIINNGGGGTVDSAGVFAIIDSDYIQARQTNAVEWTLVNGPGTVAVDSNSKNIVDVTGGAVTLTLPPGPSFGTEVRVIDGIGNASSNNITIGRNGERIMGADSDLIIDIDEAGIGLVYFNSLRGWRLIEN